MVSCDCCLHRVPGRKSWNRHCNMAAGDVCIGCRFQVDSCYPEVATAVHFPGLLRNPASWQVLFYRHRCYVTGYFACLGFRGSSFLAAARISKAQLSEMTSASLRGWTSISAFGPIVAGVGHSSLLACGLQAQLFEDIISASDSYSFNFLLVLQATLGTKRSIKAWALRSTTDVLWFKVCCRKMRHALFLFVLAKSENRWHCPPEVGEMQKMEGVWGVVFFTVGGAKEDCAWCDSVMTTNVWINCRLRWYWTFSRKEGSW